MSVNAAQPLRMFRPASPSAALGLAVSHLMVKPAFANLKFGDWSRILVGQINRGHYRFAIDAENRVQGFMGWALATREHAEAWAEGRRALSYEESQQGDCIVFNAWSANSNAVTRFMLAEARRMASGKTAVYFKRHYKDGTTRPARVAVNAFVDAHIERSAALTGRKRRDASPFGACACVATPIVSPEKSTLSAKYVATVNRGRTLSDKQAERALAPLEADLSGDDHGSRDWQDRALRLVPDHDRLL